MNRGTVVFMALGTVFAVNAGAMSLGDQLDKTLAAPRPYFTEGSGPVKSILPAKTQSTDSALAKAALPGNLNKTVPAKNRGSVYYDDNVGAIVGLAVGAQVGMLVGALLGAVLPLIIWGLTVKGALLAALGFFVVGPLAGLLIGAAIGAGIGAIIDALNG